MKHFITFGGPTSNYHDANKKIWFSIRDVFNALGYKDIKKEIKRIDIDKKHITTYGKIYINNKKFSNRHI